MHTQLRLFLTLLALGLALTGCVQHHYKPVRQVVTPKVGEPGAPLQEFMSECAKDSGTSQSQWRLRIFEGQATLEISYFDDLSCQSVARRQEIYQGAFQSSDAPQVLELKSKGQPPVRYLRAQVLQNQTELSPFVNSLELAQDAGFARSLARLSALDAAADYWVGASSAVLKNSEFDAIRLRSLFCRQGVVVHVQDGAVVSLSVTLRPPCVARTYEFVCEGPVCRYQSSEVITILSATSYRYLEESSRNQVEFQAAEF